jgi:hypothetical protein
MLALFSVLSCKKEYLPEFYFKCKLNGKEYIPDNCANCRRAIVLGDSVFMLNANRYVETIAFGIRDYPIKQKTYMLNEQKSYNAIYDNTIGNPPDIFKTDSLHKGQITITMLDKANRIIAGTFSFHAFNAIQNKKVMITEGKFRLKYGIY